MLRQRRKHSTSPLVGLQLEETTCVMCTYMQFGPGKGGVRHRGAQKNISPNAPQVR